MGQDDTRLGWGPAAAGLLLLANIAVPLVWGDVYPFTSAPMFRDAPRACCNYRVFEPSGRESLALEDWLCQRIYDGNPLGYGVGIKPPAVIEQEFGQTPDESAVREHFRRILALPENRRFPYIEVERDMIGPVDDQRVGVIRTERWRIERE